MKLVSDLKQYLILNDFPSVNEAIAQNSNMFKEMQVLRNSQHDFIIAVEKVYVAERFTECFLCLSKGRCQKKKQDYVGKIPKEGGRGLTQTHSIFFSVFFQFRGL